MNFKDNIKAMIFKSEYQGKNYYKLGLSHKNMDGSYAKGYISCKFAKNKKIESDKALINIKNAWLDFYLKDKITQPYIFINDYDILDIKNDTQRNDIEVNNKVENDPYKDMGDEIQLDESDLPFDFN